MKIRFLTVLGLIGFVLSNGVMAYKTEENSLSTNHTNKFQSEYIKELGKAHINNNIYSDY